MRVGVCTGKDIFQSHHKAEETDQSRGKYLDNDAALRIFAVSSKRCQSSVRAAFYSCADSPSGLTCWKERKLRMGPHDLIRLQDQKLQSKSWGKVLFLNEDGVVKVRWAGSQKTWARAWALL